MSATLPTCGSAARYRGCSPVNARSPPRRRMSSDVRFSGSKRRQAELPLCHHNNARRVQMVVPGRFSTPETASAPLGKNRHRIGTCRLLRYLVDQSRKIIAWWGIPIGANRDSTPVGKFARQLNILSRFMDRVPPGAKTHSPSDARNRVFPSSRQCWSTRRSAMGSQGSDREPFAIIGNVVLQSLIRFDPFPALRS